MSMVEEMIQETDDNSLDLLMSFDEETGFYKRQNFVELLDLRLMESEGRGFVAVVKVQFENLRQLADSLGTGAMASVLATVASTWRIFESDGWLVGRSTQERFLLATPIRGDLVEVLSSVQMIADLIEQPLIIQDMELFLEASLGVAVSPDHGNTGEDLVESARLSLLHAQTEQSDGFCVYDPLLRVAAQRDSRILMDARNALALEQMQVAYQPLVDLHTGRVMGFEAELVWNHPELGCIPSSQFIPLIESNASTIPFGEFLIRQSTLELRRVQQELARSFRLSVKLTAQQIRQTQGVEKLTAVLRSTGFDPKLFEVEVNSRALISDDDAVLKTLDRIKAMGVSLALDDFGSGHSSLSYLQRYPIDQVKIASHFVERVATNADENAVVKAVVSMAQSLKLRVVAKGLTTLPQQSVLMRMGCDFAQGPLYAEGLAASELIGWLTSFTPPDLSSLERKANAQKVILLVSEESRLIASLRRVLRKEQCEILSAESAEEAFEILAVSQVDVVLSDQTLSNMLGTEFLSRVKDLYPETVRLVLSTSAQLQSVTDAINQGDVLKFLIKPWDDTELRESIAQVLQQLGSEGGASHRQDDANAVTKELVRLNHILEQRIMDRDDRIIRDSGRLQVIQEVVENVSAGVLGVDSVADIVITNRLSNEWLGPGGMTLVGQSVSALPTELSEAISDALMAFDPEVTELFFEHQNRGIKAVVTPMGNKSTSKGVLVTLMEQSW